MPTLEELTREVQRHYPRIYMACHVDHRRRRGQGPAISARDQTILAHVPANGVRPRTLAAHLSVGPSTLSASLKRLRTMRLIAMTPEAADARARVVHLTEAGRQALSQTSVLDSARVAAALGRLTASQRTAVIRGLALLADAAQRVEA